MKPSPQSPRFRSLTSLALLGALIFALMSVSPGRAANGRDFAGFYDLSNVNSSGDPVTFTLTLRVFNYSGADVTNATITLQDSVVPGKDYGSFTAVSITNNGSVQLSGSFSVSASEYTRWQNGSDPSLRIEFTDSNGNNVRRRIEIAKNAPGVQ